MSRRPSSRRPYERTARVGELLREVIAEELTDLDDDRLVGVTITSVEVDQEIQRAVVYFDSPDAEADADILAALGERRVGLQRSINDQTRLRRTPELVFRADEGVRAGARIEEILRDIDDGS